MPFRNFPILLCELLATKITAHLSCSSLPPSRSFFSLFLLLSHSLSLSTSILSCILSCLSIPFLSMSLQEQKHQTHRHDNTPQTTQHQRSCAFPRGTFLHRSMHLVIRDAREDKGDHSGSYTAENRREKKRER